MKDLITLSMLLDGPKHGYQLKRQGGFIFGQGDMHNNLIYPLLRRFTDDGWVTKKQVPGERGQTRQQYSLTALGKRELISRLQQYSEQDAQSQGAFITRVGLFGAIHAKAREAILEKREAYLQMRVERLDRLTANVKVESYGADVIELLREQIRMELKWMEKLRRRMSKQKRTKH
jgi:DNA-binding PadR family transcriptional regulator